jgi:hypothetical protein
MLLFKAHIRQCDITSAGVVDIGSNQSNRLLDFTLISGERNKLFRYAPLLCDFNCKETV